MPDFITWTGGTQGAQPPDRPPANDAPATDARPSLTPLVMAIGSIGEVIADYAARTPGRIQVSFEPGRNECSWDLYMYDRNAVLEDIVRAAQVYYVLGSTVCDVDVYCPDSAMRLPSDLYEQLLGKMTRLTLHGVHHLYPAPSEPDDEGEVH